MKIDYEAKQKRLAASELYERGLRAGRSCLICRCWRRPCETCANGLARSKKNSTAHGPACDRVSDSISILDDRRAHTKRDPV